jgi:hypothetical protein
MLLGRFRRDYPLECSPVCQSLIFLNVVNIDQQIRNLGEHAASITASHRQLSVTERSVTRPPNQREALCQNLNFTYFATHAHRTPALFGHCASRIGSAASPTETPPDRRRKFTVAGNSP